MGKLIFMSKGSMDKFNVSKMYRTFFEFLDESKPEDYILVSGLTNMNIVACSIFANKHNRLNILLWDSKKATYIDESLFFDNYKFKKEI